MFYLVFPHYAQLLCCPLPDHIIVNVQNVMWLNSCAQELCKHEVREGTVQGNGRCLCPFIAMTDTNTQHGRAEDQQHLFMIRIK